MTPEVILRELGRIELGDIQLQTTDGRQLLLRRVARADVAASRDSLTDFSASRGGRHLVMDLSSCAALEDSAWHDPGLDQIVTSCDSRTTAGDARVGISPSASGPARTGVGQGQHQGVIRDSHIPPHHEDPPARKRRR
jgi:hypothetical protein